MPITSSKLSALTDAVIARHDQDAKVVLSGKDLLLVLANLGGRASGRSKDVLDKLQDPSLDMDAKLALVRTGMSDEARADAKAILDGGTVPLCAEAKTILAAILNPTTGAAGIAAAWASLPFQTQDIHTPGGSSMPTPSAGSATAVGSVLSLQLKELQDKPSAEEVAKRIAESIKARAEGLAGATGSGVEHWGQGNPELIERRDLLSQLMDQQFIQLDSIHGGWVKTDKEALEKIERTDAIGIHSGGWDMWGNLRTQVDKIKKENGDAATKEIAAMQSGKAAFFEANPQTFSTTVVSRIGDNELRARTMADLLLQFREPEDTSTTKEKMYGGGAGLQSVFELRENAAKTDPTKGDAVTERNYALMRAVALANPRGSGNAVLEARHLISNIRRMSWQLVFGKEATHPGFKIPPYSAIHHNFSTESPKIIAAFTGDTVFGGGDPESFCVFVDAMNLSKKGVGAAGKTLLNKLATVDKKSVDAFDKFAKGDEVKDKDLHEQIEAFLVSRCKGKLDSSGIDDPSLTSAEKTHLRNGNVTSVKGEYGKKLTLVARLYRAVCKSMPTVQSLGDMMFSGAMEQWPKVANVITHLEMNAPPAATLQAITDARAALRETFAAHPEGFRRMDAWDLDQKLELLASSYLGQMVADVGALKSDDQKTLALSAMRSALQGALTSGLDQIRDLKDPITAKGPTLKDALGEIDALFKKGAVSLEDYRHAMGAAYEAIVKTTENIRSYMDARVPDVSEGKLIPNPAFMDDFIKEGPLHYARAIGQKALAVGLKQEISAQRIVNPDGVAVLNHLGRAVFKRILIADNMADLKEIGAGREDFCIVRTMDEKKMAAVGGVMSNFPGGYCHAAVYARGAGMAALSSPKIGKAWSDFVANCDGDQLYYDDTGGKIVMMPFKEAIKEGLARPEDAEKLEPGSNRHVEYVAWDEAEKRWESIGMHDVKVHPDRPTHNITIYTPANIVHGLGEKCVSFQEAGPLGIDGRGLGGEKNTVLAMMSVESALKDRVPPGSYIPTSRCFKILEDAGVLDAWLAPYTQDPIVGRITDQNFLQSRFYNDAQYRTSVRKEILGLVQTKVRDSLLGKDGKPTAKGKALLDEIKANPDMAECENWIMRSSYTAEDRPFKSGAGQYDSVPNCRTDAERLAGVVTVLASAWDEPPIENNVVEQYNLMHIQPAITAMKCLNPSYSGVMISRDSDTGHRRTVSYQVVKGFGGGVEEGITEEGRITEHDNNIKRLLPKEKKSILGEGVDHTLWEAAMNVERLFHQKVEPGKGFAVDMEWVYDKDDQKVYLVQARTVRA